MNQQNEIILLEELLSIVKNKGYTKTLNILKKNNSSIFEIENSYDKFVISLIADTFEMDSNELLQSRYSRGNMKYAIGFSVYYLYQEKTLGYIGKNIFKDKNLTLLSRYRQMIFDLTKKDLPYFDMKDKLDKKIENFKLKNKVK
jgi:hypothetical protein